MHDDPLIFTLKDIISLLVFLFIFIIVFFAALT